METLPQQNKKQDAAKKPVRDAVFTRYMETVDPNFLCAIFHAPKASIYTYGQEWNEMEIEGSLYVYKRASNPRHRLIVLNRKGVNDFKLNIPEEFHVEIDGQFVIFSHEDRKSIFGFWFNDAETAQASFKTLEKLK